MYTVCTSTKAKHFLSPNPSESYCYLDLHHIVQAAPYTIFPEKVMDILLKMLSFAALREKKVIIDRSLLQDPHQS